MGFRVKSARRRTKYHCVFFNNSFSPSFPSPPRIHKRVTFFPAAAKTFSSPVRPSVHCPVCRSHPSRPKLLSLPRLRTTQFRGSATVEFPNKKPLKIHFYFTACTKYSNLCKSSSSGLSAPGKTRLDRERAKLCLAEMVIFFIPN